ncbi:MAG: hypothetical protein DMF13_00160, partial [Verrucomicrobia bacterium]
MKQVSKTELSPDNGCVIDTKWKVGPLSYHACAASPKDAHGKPLEGNLRLPEIIVYDHTGFKGEQLGTWLPGTPQFDIAIDPIDGTTN